MPPRDHDPWRANPLNDDQAGGDGLRRDEHETAEQRIRHLRELEQQQRGELAGAEALWEIAELYCGGCAPGVEPVDHDGWDRAIAVYEELLTEYPDTPQADWAGWRLAQCHGGWARDERCPQQRGKAAWGDAVGLYWELYELYDDEVYRGEALRRIAEIEAWCLHDWERGIHKYRVLRNESQEVPDDGVWLLKLGMQRRAPADGIDEDMILGVRQVVSACTSPRVVRRALRRLLRLLTDFPLVAAELEDCALRRLVELGA